MREIAHYCFYGRFHTLREFNLAATVHRENHSRLACYHGLLEHPITFAKVHGDFPCRAASHGFVGMLVESQDPSWIDTRAFHISAYPDVSISPSKQCLKGGGPYTAGLLVSLMRSVLLHSVVNYFA